MSRKDLNSDGALVLLSGGQDSATCLAWALDRYRHVETIGFEYGQTHSIEMSVRQAVRSKTAALRPEWRQRLQNDHVFDAGIIGAISKSSLTGAAEVSFRDQGLPDTFVPGRNLVFLTLAAALAYRSGLKHIVTGVCETDYSGYPDCRDNTIKAMQVAVGLGTEAQFVFHTPLMWLDKDQTWRLAYALGGEAFIQIIREETHTCYKGDRVHFHEWGFGCGECAACALRASGWEAFTKYRSEAHVQPVELR